MRELFQDYTIPSKEEFQTLWDNGIFVLDTNILINFYRYPKEVNEELFEIFEKIKDRLWIPHHVGLEFYRNRLDEISNQRKKLEDILDILSGIPENTRSQFSKLKLKKRRSSIDIECFFEKVKKLV